MIRHGSLGERILRACLFSPEVIESKRSLSTGTSFPRKFPGFTVTTSILRSAPAVKKLPQGGLRRRPSALSLSPAWHLLAGTKGEGTLPRPLSSP